MKRFLGVVAGLAVLVLAVPSHVAAVADFPLTVIAKCSRAGVLITNNTGSDVDVRLKFDDVPMFGGSTTSVAPSEMRSISGVPPASTGVITVFTVDGSDVETLIGSVNYAAPDYCDDFTFVYTVTCEVVTIDITSTYPSAVTLTAVQTDGLTFELGDVEVPNSGTATLEIPLAPDVQEISIYADEIDGGVYLPTVYEPMLPDDCVAEEDGDGDSGAGIPDAGVDTAGLALLALLVVAGGAGLTVAGRRRHITR